MRPWPLIRWKAGSWSEGGRLSDFVMSSSPHRTGCKQLLSMEEQDARVPALEPFRVDQVVRTGGAEGEGGG